MKTGKTGGGGTGAAAAKKPQWSPVMKTGKTTSTYGSRVALDVAAMEPGHEDREDRVSVLIAVFLRPAAMEPGHDDREDLVYKGSSIAVLRPQWSPVMKTGKARELEDRVRQVIMPQWSPVMKTGKTRCSPRVPSWCRCRNGARS